MIYIDIETNLAHDTIWCVVTMKGWETKVWTKPDGLQQYLKGEEVCAHNLIGFDAPVLRKVWDVQIPISKAVDTLVMSRLMNPQIEGGHSLKAWGKRLGNDKMDFDTEDFDGGLTDEMIEYCKRDVEVLAKLHGFLETQFKQWDNPKQPLELEHRVAMYMAQQESNGFMLNQRLCSELLAEMRQRMLDITIELQEVFPPLVHERWSEKTGKRLKDKVEEFNVGSRKQIASRLQSLGVEFKKKTEKGNIIVDESVLKGINRPEAQLIAEYLMLQKRVGMLDSWMDHCKDDGRVHGRVISNGAVTGRMTHQSPNMGQITSVKSEYGKESRQCWIVPEGYKLVGTDLSGIELRCLAHYMRDDKYTNELLEGDIHTANQNAAGLGTRDQAKTFIYAFLYGAGPAKIGNIVGGSAQDGKKLIDKFMRNMPSIRKLMEKVKKFAAKGYVPALDGRRIIIRSDHAALNSLLQSAGAVIAKQWCVEAHKLLKKNKIEYKQVAFVHDEIQLEVREDQAERAAQLMVQAAAIAGKALNFRVPVDAEAKIGNNWYETH